MGETIYIKTINYFYVYFVICLVVLVVFAFWYMMVTL
jgi:hypothetical protein